MGVQEESEEVHEGVRQAGAARLLLPEGEEEEEVLREEVREISRLGLHRDVHRRVIKPNRKQVHGVLAWAAPRACSFVHGTFVSRRGVPEGFPMPSGGSALPTPRSVLIGIAVG